MTNKIATQLFTNRKPFKELITITIPVSVQIFKVLNFCGLTIFSFIFEDQYIVFLL